eukprot:CAMPEP_0168585308 /NCGR_PEP_ID=MMETSP0420-20121227/3629_1 /TAXON_ID=498008 /ORGANISM="Pessonella sp." /LENGTH=77 /DNA_ID=CAMNT_0008620219 /DNA_START=311 /DNA_END=544 /DNA_ORIENTATION=+
MRTITAVNNTAAAMIAITDDVDKPVGDDSIASPIVTACVDVTSTDNRDEEIVSVFVNVACPDESDADGSHLTFKLHI